jgi:hypothetical protein
MASGSEREVLVTLEEAAPIDLSCFGIAFYNWFQ